MTQSSNGSIETISHRFDRALASIKSAWIDARRPIADTSTDRVLIEVEDECGGLPAGDPALMFRPFERRSIDRTGLGLGLSISQRGVEANGGKLDVRNTPGTGCVFIIDLPMAPALAEAPSTA